LTLPLKNITLMLMANIRSVRITMVYDLKIILGLSDNVQTFLEQQDVNLYEELQREIPSLHIDIQSDPDVSAGSRDATTVILAISTLISTLSPIIIRILNQHTPPNRSMDWKVEETETHQLDGTTTIRRIYVSSEDENRPWIAPINSKHLSSVKQEKNRDPENTKGC
jgi:hypothetical protein